MPSKFGGIPVEESKSRFGGIPVDEQPQPAPAKPEPGFMTKAGRFLSGSPEQKVFPLPGLSDESSATRFINMPFSGLNQAAKGVPQLATPGKRQEGAANILEGGGKAAFAAMAPEMVANPLATAFGGLVGTGVSKLAGAGASMLGASPETTRLAEDLAPFTPRFGAGGASRLAGRGAEALAKPFVRLGLKLPASAHDYGAEPEEAVLRLTKGSNPRDIEGQANSTMERLSSERDAALGQAGQRGVTVPLTPARKLVDSAIRGEEAKNLHPRLVRPVQDVEEHLTMAHPGFPGRTIAGALAPDQEPLHFQGIKQGLQAFTKFDPTKSTDASVAAANNAYHQMGADLERAVPGTAPMNRDIQSLIPVAKRAHQTDLNAGPIEHAVDAATRPTGRLAAPFIAGSAGGPLAAVATFLGQQALASPINMIRFGRGFYGAGKRLGSPEAGRAARLVPLASGDSQ